MDEDNLIPKIQQAIDSEWIEQKGFHFHVGSQIFDNAYHLLALDVVLPLLLQLKEDFGYEIEELNIGGGFGAVYIDE